VHDDDFAKTACRHHSNVGRMSRAGQLRLGILLSGGGRTLQNIHDHIARGELPASIVCVISSQPDAYGVERARAMGLPTHVVSRRTTPDPRFHVLIAGLLSEAGVDLVCMAGFATLWRIPAEFEGRVINIHPALLPEFGGQGFYGMRVHRSVIAAGRRTSGCTVHLCDNTYDHGPIILQREVPVRPDDTAESLADRVFEQECVAYPEAIRLFAEGRVSVGVDGVVISD